MFRVQKIIIFIFCVFKVLQCKVEKYLENYNINVLQQTACLVVNTIRVGNFAFLFNCTPVGRTSDSMLDFFCSGIQFNLLLSPYPCFISLLYLDLYVLGDDALIS